LLTALAYPTHLLRLGSRGFYRLPPAHTFNGSEYSSFVTQTITPALDTIECVVILTSFTFKGHTHTQVMLEIRKQSQPTTTL